MVYFCTLKKRKNLFVTMKKIYSVICLIMLAVFQAQIVNIPDPVFKAKLLAANNTNGFALNSAGNSIRIDTNYDGNIQLSEAQSVATLYMSNNSIVDMTGINSFTNLKTLGISYNKYTNLTLNLPQLESLNTWSDYLTSIDISSCPKLKTLYLGFNAANLVVNSNSVTYLNLIGTNNLQTANLQGLPALKELLIQNGPGIQTVNGSNMASLEEAFISYTPFLSNINFTGSPQFKKLTLLTTGLPILDLTNYTTLQYVSGQANSFSNVILDGCSSLISVGLPFNNISNISLTGASALTNLYLINNNLSSLVVNNHPNLQNIDVSNNQISSLSLNNLPELQNLDVTSNQLSTLDFSTSVNLKKIICSNNHLPYLNLSMLPNLLRLDCDYNAIINLDLSNNPDLTNIKCNNNPDLEQVLLKNQAMNYVSSTVLFPNPKLQNICCDDFEMNQFANYVASQGNPNTNVNSYCYFTPGSSKYTFSGNIKYDSNNNGCDINDLSRAFQKFNITNGTVSGSIMANNSGNYSVSVPAGVHTVTPILENPAYFNISPSAFTANFPTQTSPLTQNFCLTANGTHNDLEAVIIPVTAARPGFNVKYKIVYKNKGNTTQSGTVSFNYNDNVTDYLSSTATPHSQSTGLLNWNFTNLLPFETREIAVTLKLNTPIQTPALNEGDILNYTVQVNGAADDTPSDNTFTLNQTVVNSFDPNDKTCLEGTTISQIKVGDYVHYLIRFENTGTANAQNVIIKDVIDASKYNVSSLIPLNASHNFVTRTTNPNVVEFIFENIQLPFDDANNDGYVSFKIKTKSTLSAGDSFSNLAKIYFDYNAPITTNTFTTTVQNVLATAETGKETGNIAIYPNPAKDVLNIQSKNKIIKAEIYDAAGRVMMAVPVKENTVVVSELAKGNYIIKLSTKDQTFTQKFIRN